MTYSQNVCILFQRQPQPSEVLCLFPFMVPHRQMAGKHSGEGRLKGAGWGGGLASGCRMHYAETLEGNGHRPQSSGCFLSFHSFLSSQSGFLEDPGERGLQWLNHLLSPNDLDISMFKWLIPFLSY